MSLIGISLVAGEVTTKRRKRRKGVGVGVEMVRGIGEGVVAVEVGTEKGGGDDFDWKR
jgi:hypothetical protein